VNSTRGDAHSISEKYNAVQESHLSELKSIEKAKQALKRGAHQT